MKLKKMLWDDGNLVVEVVDVEPGASIVITAPGYKLGGDVDQERQLVRDAGRAARAANETVEKIHDSIASAKAHVEELIEATPEPEKKPYSPPAVQTTKNGNGATAKETPAKPPPAASSGEFPEVLKGSKTTLTKVLNYVYDDLGIHDPEKILEECEKLQPHIPLVKGIGIHLRDRVRASLVSQFQLPETILPDA